MANLKEVRLRIESVNSTKQITSAMKMVAASKLRKSQNAITALRPYAEKLNEIMMRVSKTQTLTLTQTQTGGRVLIIPISSNKGLCGVFNANVIRATINLIKEEYQTYLDDDKLDILCVGSKIEESLKFKKYPVIGNENVLLDKLTYNNAASFAERLIRDFETKNYDKIVFVYNQFKNAATQVIVSEQFLPTANSQQPIANSQQLTAQKSLSDYIFQPNIDELYNEILPKSLKMQVYKILLDSYASEQGARMVSMTQATDNATELLKELNLSYNKARQGAITNELVEIVSGAEALKG